MTSSGGVWGLRLVAATLLLSIGEANTGNWDWQRLYVYEEKEVTTIPDKIGTLPNKKFNKEKYMYLISGEGANTIFTLNDQGDIFVTSKLDREKKHVYHLNARLVERGNPQKDVEAPSDFKIYVQDINDNKPVFNGPYTGEIEEMSEIGTSVMTVSATDNDDPTTANGRVRYTLLNGTDIFEINKDNGIITTKVNSLDRESTSEYIIMVQAKDMPGMTTGESSSTTITINVKDVNDNLSTFKKGQYIFRVKEDVQVGFEMGTVEVEDKDEEQNKRPQFKIEDPDINRLLEIKQNKNKNGMLLLRQPLDYESNSTYKFTLFVTEDTVSVPKVTPPLSKANIIIQVIDVDEPPRFSQKEYNITVDEEKYPVEFLGSVSAKDPDTINHPIRYSIEDSSCPVFVHPQNGRLSLRWKLDRELVTVHRCQVTATENVQNGLKGYAMVNLWVRDLNDNAPKLHTEDIYVCETDGPGTVVGILTASDKDETNGGFTFMLNKPSSNFSLSSNNNGTSVLKVKKGPFSTEDTDEQVVEIKVHDGVHYSIETLRIRVCTCNDDRVLDYCRSSRQVGVSMHALITILLCIITILVIVILLVLRRRYQKESVALGKMSGEIHEQLVTYDEEGGGEMDTNGYDVSILTSARHDASLLPGPGLYAMVNKPQACKGDMAAMIEVKKDEADHDRDGYPYDTLHIYGYEGPGSLAGSLSSLGSSSSGDSLDYDFLNEWGPRFRTLAELYGVDGYPGDCPY